MYTYWNIPEDIKLVHNLEYHLSHDAISDPGIEENHETSFPSPYNLSLFMECQDCVVDDESYHLCKPQQSGLVINYRLTQCNNKNVSFNTILIPVRNINKQLHRNSS